MNRYRLHLVLLPLSHPMRPTGPVRYWLATERVKGQQWVFSLVGLGAN